LRLNYVENLLRTDLSLCAASKPALTAVHLDRPTEQWSRGELRERVNALAAGLSGLGLTPGSRVAIVAPNSPGAILGCLAAAAIGCTVSTGSPEMGSLALSSRLAQTEPVLLMVDLSEPAAGAGHQQRERLNEMLQALPSVRTVLLLDDGPPPDCVDIQLFRVTEMVEEHLGASVAWPRLPFNHPLFVLFTSGTTGAPKCLIHGAGGTLIEHVKEHRLHCDLRGTDKLFFQTSTGWMMWNWQLTALASGVELVLYDGPFTGVDQLWRIVSEQRVTVFGTSPAYLQMCKGCNWLPDPGLSFTSLRAILSTGSILHPPQQQWVWDTIKRLPVQSISGGTDIVGCFVLGNPVLPVYGGECQCRSLGLDVRALLPQIAPLGHRIGELVCANPFPSRPLGLLNDPDGARFHAAYFAENPGVWTHGDLIEFTPEGSARMHGRSDDVLNIHGIRIGPAEIYRILEEVPEISEAMAVEQSTEDELARTRLVLLVVLKQDVTLDGPLTIRIKRELARRGSAAHVPAVILSVNELPTTHSGKRSERSARDALNGRAIANTRALRNPECLEPLRASASLRRVEPSETQPTATTSTESTQQLVTRLWESALKLTAIDPNENFFDLGGDSVAALRICAELQRVLGREIPVTLLSETPTIAGMTAAVDEPAPSTYQPLLLVRQDGAAPPLFMVHGFGGGVMDLMSVVRQLRIDRSVYAIQARGFGLGDVPHDSVEAMAREYLAKVREVQPRGPYLLAGYSFGGLVAYEMARMLAQLGERVDLLALLDTTIHERYWSASVWVEFLFRRLRCHVRAAWTMSPHDLKPFSVHLWSSWTDRLRRALRAETRDDEESGQLPARVRRVRSAALAAMAAYRPQRSAIGISLIRSDLGVSKECDPYLIWRRVAPIVQLYDVSGDHLTMVRPPYLQVLAEQLSRCIRIRSAPG
ncbi:MAG TPA: acetoacetate--CoA ligase, partial [Steroidobacteraceae bacterium]|nr:acetoacetate--CoA ligase [Steroidobacteraceae bacterium]